MNRLFKTHSVRITEQLDGMWSFCKEGEEKEFFLPVPGCWEQHPDLLNYRGTGKYQKTIYVEKDTNLQLTFKGVSHTADIYLDGEILCCHYNAFTAFSGVKENIKKGNHELVVRVSNAFNEASALHVPNDYYTYGGITRGVEMEYLPNVYIKLVLFVPYQEDNVWCAKKPKFL